MGQWKLVQSVLPLRIFLLYRESSCCAESKCFSLCHGDGAILIVWLKSHMSLLFLLHPFISTSFSHSTHSPGEQPICMAQSGCLGCHLTLWCSSFHVCCTWISVRLVECKSLIPWVSGLWNILFSYFPQGRSVPSCNCKVFIWVRLKTIQYNFKFGIFGLLLFRPVYNLVNFTGFF